MDVRLINGYKTRRISWKLSMKFSTSGKLETAGIQHSRDCSLPPSFFHGGPLYFSNLNDLSPAVSSFN